MEFLSNKFQVYLLNGQLTVPSWITAEKSEAPLLSLSLSQSLSPSSRSADMAQLSKS